MVMTTQQAFDDIIAGCWSDISDVIDDLRDSSDEVSALRLCDDLETYLEIERFIDGNAPESQGIGFDVLAVLLVAHWYTHQPLAGETL
jgi:hypothetical protein